MNPNGSGGPPVYMTSGHPQNYQVPAGMDAYHQRAPGNAGYPVHQSNVMLNGQMNPQTHASMQYMQHGHPAHVSTQPTHAQMQYMQQQQMAAAQHAAQQQQAQQQQQQQQQQVYSAPVLPAPVEVKYSVPEEIASQVGQLATLSFDQKVALLQLIEREESVCRSGSPSVLLQVMSVGTISKTIQETPALLNAFLSCWCMSAHYHPLSREILSNFRSFALQVLGDNSALVILSLRFCLQLAQNSPERASSLASEMRSLTPVLFELLLSSNQTILALAIELMGEILVDADLFRLFLQPSAQLIAVLPSTDSTYICLSEDGSVQLPWTVSILGSGVRSSTLTGSLRAMEKEHAQNKTKPRPCAIPYVPVFLVSFAFQPKFSPYVQLAALHFFDKLQQMENYSTLYALPAYVPGSPFTQALTVTYADNTQDKVSLPYDSFCSYVLGNYNVAERQNNKPLPTDGYIPFELIGGNRGVLPTPAAALTASVIGVQNTVPHGLLYLLDSQYAEVVLTTVKFLTVFLPAFQITDHFHIRHGVSALKRITCKPASVESYRQWSVEQRALQEHVAALVVVLAANPKIYRHVLSTFWPVIESAFYLINDDQTTVSTHPLIQQTPGHTLYILAMSCLQRQKVGADGTFPEAFDFHYNKTWMCALYQFRQLHMLRINVDAGTGFPTPGSQAFASHAIAAQNVMTAAMTLGNMMLFRKRPDSSEFDAQSSLQDHFLSNVFGEVCAYLDLTRDRHLETTKDRNIGVYVWDNIYAKGARYIADLSPDTILRLQSSKVYAHNEPPSPSPDLLNSILENELLGNIRYPLPIFIKYVLPLLYSATFHCGSRLDNRVDLIAKLGKTYRDLALLFNEHENEISSYYTNSSSFVERRTEVLKNIREAEDRIRNYSMLFNERESQLTKSGEVVADEKRSINVQTPNPVDKNLVMSLSIAEIQRERQTFETLLQELRSRKIRYRRVLIYLYKVKKVQSQQLHEVRSLRHVLSLCISNLTSSQYFETILDTNVVHVIQRTATQYQEQVSKVSRAADTDVNNHNYALRGVQKAETQLTTQTLKRAKAE